METFHIFYHKTSHEIRVVRDGLDYPNDFDQVDTIEHDPAESTQSLQNRARGIVAQRYLHHDIGSHTEVRVDDMEKNVEEPKRYNDFGEIDPDERDRAKQEEHERLVRETPGSVKDPEPTPTPKAVRTYERKPKTVQND